MTSAQVETLAEGVELYLGDCRDILPTLEKATALVTDPPYRLTSGGNTPGGMQGGWLSNYSNDGAPVIVNCEWAEWLPVVFSALATDADAYIMANDKNLHPALNAIIGAGFSIHNVLVWDKRTATANRWYMKNAEFCVYAWKGRAKRINDAGSKQMVSIPQVDESNHPTEKPVDLMRYYIGNSTRPGDLVLDPFKGSGTTGVAAVAIHRRFIGVELDLKHFDAARRRIAQAVKVRQPDFFRAVTAPIQGAIAL
jgi:DNA modification methylase